MSTPSVVEDIFLAALEKATAEERAAYLDAACKDDPDLRRRVERLMEAHPKAGGFLENPVPPGDEKTGAYVLTGEQVGAVIAGRYKLLEQIGEGGMGTVWVAEQTQPVRRKVALKLIKAGMDSKTVLSRFEAERQALAVMDHPNIAKVLDGGTTDNGRPFFVMEYVKGIPLTRYCDDARLNIADRLALFVPVCQAVQHAHQKGIIHRDLKPSNILVCLYDGKPVPKVIDFGLAKAMHQPLTEHTLYTAHGAMMGTPLYMSPEQAEFNNLDVDTRTDIYALGVILYELLTGTTPLEKQRFKATAWDEMLRLIKEEEPPKPSARLSGSGTLPAVAAQRQLEPVKLTRLVRGELDWIVMKCLEKERSRRYETANGLARDVERYLADEVVEAGPPSMRYRLRKFGRRHKAGFITAALILSFLVTGVAVSVWQARLTAIERDRAIEAEREARTLQVKAQEEQQKALKSAAEATAMCEFFKELTVEARRRKSVDDALDIIDSERVRALFADHPLAETDLRAWIATDAVRIGDQFAFGFFRGGGAATKMETTFVAPDGKTYHLVFDYDKSRRHLERALELRSLHLGPNDSKTLEIKHHLGDLFIRFNNDKALELLRDLVSRSNAVLGPDHDNTLEYKRTLARAYEAAGRVESVIQLHKEVCSLSTKKWGSVSDEVADCLDDLASVFEKAGRPIDAEPVLRECLAIREKTKPNDWTKFETKLRLGVSLLAQKKTAAAEPLLQIGYQGMMQHEGKDSEYVKTRLTVSLDRIVNAYHTWYKKDKADEWRKKLEAAKAGHKSRNNR